MNIYICSVLIVGLLGPVVHAQVPSLGWCPEYIPMPDFNLNRFLGKWYEAERYFTISEVGTRCVATTYAKGPSGKIIVSNRITNRLTGVKRVIDGELKETGKAGEGKIKVRYQSPVSYDTSYTILDTDYENFAVLWSCNGIGPVHTQNAWVMTRERLAPGTVLQKAYGVLDKYKISRAFFVKTDQESCALTADEITNSPLDPIDDYPKSKSSAPENIPVKVIVDDADKSVVSVPEHIFAKSGLNVPVTGEVKEPVVGHKEMDAVPVPAVHAHKEAVTKTGTDS